MLLFLDPGSGMGKNQDPGSGINIPDPQHSHYHCVYLCAGDIEDTMSMGAGEKEETSGFFPYFMLLSIVCITAYLVFHNKQKVRATC